MACAKLYALCNSGLQEPFVFRNISRPGCQIVYEYRGQNKLLWYNNAVVVSYENRSYLSNTDLIVLRRWLWLLIMTLEENTESGQPFFLSDVICGVWVEKLEDPAHIVTVHTVNKVISELSNLSIMMSSVMSNAECKNSLNIFLNFYLAALMLTQSLSTNSVS